MCSQQDITADLAAVAAVCSDTFLRESRVFCWAEKIHYYIKNSLCLNFLHNYFGGPTKLFSDLYLLQFLDISAKSFFPCIYDN